MNIFRHHNDISLRLICWCVLVLVSTLISSFRSLIDPSLRGFHTQLISWRRTQITLLDLQNMLQAIVICVNFIMQSFITNYLVIPYSTASQCCIWCIIILCFLSANPAYYYYYWAVCIVKMHSFITQPAVCIVIILL